MDYFDRNKASQPSPKGRDPFFIKNAAKRADLKYLVDTLSKDDLDECDRVLTELMLSAKGYRNIKEARSALKKQKKKKHIKKIIKCACLAPLNIKFHKFL